MKFSNFQLRIFKTCALLVALYVTAMLRRSEFPDSFLSKAHDRPIIGLFASLSRFLQCLENFCSGAANKKKEMTHLLFITQKSPTDWRRPHCLGEKRGRWRPHSWQVFFLGLTHNDRSFLVYLVFIPATPGAFWEVKQLHRDDIIADKGRKSAANG